MNEKVTNQVLQSAVDCGVRDFIICPGSRNSSFVEALRIEERLNTYYWPEERSAAFFALGRSRLTNRPTAVITTSGTAAAELLPAAMEAYYSGVPLLLITADRPRSFRGSGAPQSAEQVGLFGHYARYAKDIAKETPCDLTSWKQHGPAHLNVCLEEPQSQPPFSGMKLTINESKAVKENSAPEHSTQVLDRFISQVEHPLVIVSTLRPEAKEAVVQFLLSLKAPVMLEAISGLREDPRLQALRIRRTENILESAKHSGYDIDGVLRIGGIPTHRIWRDLEYLKDHLKVCAISELPFSGLSWNRCVASGCVKTFLSGYALDKCFNPEISGKWLKSQHAFAQQLIELFHEEPFSEASQFYFLSKAIPKHAHIYLGNSLPIREWDMAANDEDSGFLVTANRGVNGIDGQISTFLGLCQPKRENWAILGDLTTLYDMAGLWVLPQLEAKQVTIVVINNGGGKIFERMYAYKEMLNEHALSFEPLAKMWGLDYSRWDKVPQKHAGTARQLIEIVPDNAANERFCNKLAQLKQQSVMACSIK